MLSSQVPMAAAARGRVMPAPERSVHKNGPCEQVVAGFDHTGADCVGSMREAGFRCALVERPPGPYAMAIGAT